MAGSNGSKCSSGKSIVTGAPPSPAWAGRSRRLMQDELVDGGLERGQDLVAVGGDGHHIAVAQAAVAVEVDGRLEVEHHALLEDVVGLRVQPGAGVVVDRLEPDPMPGRVLEPIA